MHGSSGADMDDSEYEQLMNENGGGTARTEPFDGGIGLSEYKRVVDMDTSKQQERTQTYKTIRTGVDEMNFIMAEDIDQPIETGTVVVSRGGTGTRADDRTDSRTNNGCMDWNDVRNRRTRIDNCAVRRMAKKWIKDWIEFK